MHVRAWPTSALATGLLCTFALTGCGSGEAPPLTLAQSKSPVQLLRNESILRIPKINVGTVESTDESVSCESDETIRRWQSSAVITLSSIAPTSSDDAIDALARSFEQDDWIVSAGEGRPGTEHSVLSSAASTAEIHLLATSSAGENAATIVIEAVGPCVKTDGPDSEEVRKLEVSE